MSSRSARFTQLSALGLALQDCRIKLLAWGTFCANGAATCIGSSKARTLAQARHERWLKQGMSSDQSGARARHQRAQSCAHEKAPQAGLFQDLSDLYGRVPPLSKQPPKTALCAVPAITLKLFVVIIRAINRQKARYLWLFASKWQSTVQVGFKANRVLFGLGVKVGLTFNCGIARS